MTWFLRDLSGYTNVSQFAEIAGVSRPYVYKLINNDTLIQNKDGLLLKGQAFELKFKNENKQLLTYDDIVNFGFISKTLMDNSFLSSLSYLMTSTKIVFDFYDRTKYENLLEIKENAFEMFDMIILFNNLQHLVDCSEADKICSLYTKKYSQMMYENIIKDTVNLIEMDEHATFLLDHDKSLLNDILTADFRCSKKCICECLRIIYKFYMKYIEHQREHLNVESIYDDILYPIYDLLFELILSCMSDSVDEDFIVDSMTCVFLYRLIVESLFVYIGYDIMNDYFIK